MKEKIYACIRKYVDDEIEITEKMKWILINENKHIYKNDKMIKFG